MTTPLTYHSPCLTLTIPDWPTGSYKTTAAFMIEQAKGGERACRKTRHPKTGVWNAPKKTTYARKARIVTGSDGRTYILELHRYSNGLTVRQGNLQYTHEQILETDPRYPVLVAFFQDPDPAPVTATATDPDPDPEAPIPCRIPDCPGTVHLGHHSTLCPSCALDAEPYGT